MTEIKIDRIRRKMEWFDSNYDNALSKWRDLGYWLESRESQRLTPIGEDETTQKASCVNCESIKDCFDIVDGDRCKGYTRLSS